jgi:iron complex outermembrane receptor protein
MEKLFIRDLTDLNRQAPNVTIEAVGAIHRTAAVLYSRGIGYSGVDAAVDPSVGVSVDGIFYTRNIGMLQDMYDAQSVEILRGPQGTLFGKNTTGGVIRIESNKAKLNTYELQGYLKVGNYGRSDYGGIVNIPLTDTWAIRLVYQSQYSDGYMRNDYVNPATGNLPNSRDRWLGGDDVKTYRLNSHWEPNSNTTVDARISYIKDRSDSPGGTYGSSPQDAITAVYGSPGYGYPGTLVTDPFVTKRDYTNGDSGDIAGFAINVKYRAPWFDVESITGGQFSHHLTYNDYDNTQLAYYNAYMTMKERHFQQELRFLSNDEDSRLSWVGGLFFNWYWFDTIQDYGPSVVTPVPQRDESIQNAWSIAPYAQVNYQITPEWQITGGIRLTHEEKSFFRRPQRILSTFYVLPTLSDAHDWTNTTYTASTKYQFNQDLMAYATFSTGFKSGAYNSRAPLGVAPLPADFFLNPPASPEKATAYEIGLKSDWFENRLRVNLAAFWNEYKDLQFTFLIPASTATQIFANAANERARGVELEMTAIPFEHFTLTANVGYLDARYTSFNANLGAVNFKPASCGATVDHSQHGPCYLIPYRSAMWTGRFGASYEFDLNGHGKILPEVALNLESTRSTDLLNDPQGIQPSYTTLDGSIAYEDPSERYRLSIWAKNATNVAHKLGDTPTSNLFTQLYYAEPRTFGVQLDFKFTSEK